MSVENRNPPDPVSIAAERPDSAEASALILELDAHLAPLYPAASRHGYSIEKLLVEGVDFFVLRHRGLAAGCGGLKAFDGEYGEVKRMYVRPHFRGMGFAKRVLLHLEGHGRTLGLAILRLETGVHQREAIGLYEGMGFKRIGPFGEYRPDPLSLFFEKRIEE